MKQLHKTTFKDFYTTNELVAQTSPMRTHYHSHNPIERWIWQRKLDSMRRMTMTIPHSNVLDIGCGDGGLLETVNPKSHYTGVDISPTQLEYFRKNLPVIHETHPGKITLVQHDVTSLPFPSRSFDLVLVCDILEHVLDPKKVVGEIKRVLKTDGHALFSIPNEPMWQMVRVLSLRWPPRSPDHLYFITPDVVTDEFSRVIKETFLPLPTPPVHLIHLMLVKM
jgi:ubiquinone/menaquinone biosynthesis C-methylase UbiE